MQYERQIREEIDGMRAFVCAVRRDIRGAEAALNALMHRWERTNDYLRRDKDPPKTAAPGYPLPAVYEPLGAAPSVRTRPHPYLMHPGLMRIASREHAPGCGNSSEAAESCPCYDPAKWAREFLEASPGGFDREAWRTR